MQINIPINFTIPERVPHENKYIFKKALNKLLKEIKVGITQQGLREKPEIYNTKYQSAYHTRKYNT